MTQTVGAERRDRAGSGLPGWLPQRVLLYLGHIEEGISLRALARGRGVHASTIMRQVRRYENRRDDPLMDAALTGLAHAVCALKPAFAPEDPRNMTGSFPAAPAALQSAPAAIRAGIGAPASGLPDEARLREEARRLLRRLAEPGAVLAFAADMDKAVILRELPEGRTARTAVLERDVAQAFCLKDWISCRKKGRISVYEITAAGRAALRRMADTEEGQGLSEAPRPFAAQHRDWGERTISTEEGARRIRCNLGESPVSVLGRRREKNGELFLAPELVEAAERLREDFELAQMGPRVTQNWENFLIGGDRGGFRGDSGLTEGPGRARDRVAAALRDLGPGLGDIALRVCCFLEGVESAERRMGWAARSGKIVLRIALIRLRRHYDETYGRFGPLIG